MRYSWHTFLQKNKILFACIAAILLVFSIVAWGGREVVFHAGNSLRPYIRINGTELFIDVATTPETRTRGLSGRLSMPADTGMLFVFDPPQVVAFWMKDMHFPIDIIWIDEKLHIVDITKNILPETYPSSFKPKSPVQYVLGVNAGCADEHSIAIGGTVEEMRLKP